MKLLSKNKSYDYDPHLCKLSCNGKFVNNPMVESYAMNDIHNNPPWQRKMPELAYVRVGFGCNRPDRCRYCSQLESVSVGLCGSPDGLIKKLTDNPILFSKVHKLNFLGGETLFYWEPLTYLIDTLKKKHLVPRRVTTYVYTNGMLLTEERVRYIQENNITLLFAHNGPWIENDDPLVPGKETREHLLQLNRSGNIIINSVPTSSWYDRFAMRDYFVSVFGENITQHSFQKFFLSHMNADSCPYLLEDALGVMTFIYGQLKAGVGQFYNDYGTHVADLTCRFAFQKYNILESYNRYCRKRSSPQNTTMDMNGDVFFSRLGRQEEYHIGSLDNLQDMRGLPDDEFFIHSRWRREWCKNCPILPLCLGGEFGCTDDLLPKDCLNSFVFWLPIWWHVMEDRMLQAPITDAVGSGFRHEELFYKFLDAVKE